MRIQDVSYLALAIDLDAGDSRHLFIMTEADRVWAASPQILSRTFALVHRVTAPGAEFPTASLAGFGPITQYELETAVSPP